MSYLEELLPEFRKGAKIRLSFWDKDAYIFINCGLCKDYNGDLFDFNVDDFFRGNWELYKEPIDYEYIIKNKCLCWFSDEDIEEPNFADRLLAVVENESGVKYKTEGKVTFAYCRPVRRDEVTFYEDKKD